MFTSRTITHITAISLALLAFSTAPLAQGVFSPAVDNPAVSDQKAGSLLVFPYYNSDASGDFTKNDTLLTLTNVANGPATKTYGVPNYSYLHLFFINGTNCAPADTFVCLTPNGSIQILASAYDPMVKGYLIVVAVDKDGLPKQENSFIGSAFIRDNVNGIIDSYSAEAFQRLSNTPTLTDNNGNAILSLDGTAYEAAPRQFSVQIQDPSVSDQSIILTSVSGDLGSGLAPTGQSGVGVLYRADERPASFQPKFSGCQVTVDITNTNFRVVPGPLTSFLKDSYGYIKLNVSAPAVGLLISRQSPLNSSKNRWGGIRTLHKTAVSAATLTMPIFMPYCGF